MRISSLAKPTAAALALTFCGTHIVSAQENGTVQTPSVEQTDNQNRSSDGDAKHDHSNDTCPICGLRVDDKQDDAKGLKVADVKPDSAADKAGIKKGDTLVSIGDTPIDSAEQMHQLMSDQQQKSDEAKLNVNLLRGESEQQVTLTLQTQDAQKENSDQAAKEAEAKKDQAKRDAQAEKDKAEAMEKENKSEADQRDKDSQKTSDAEKNKVDANKQASIGVTLDPSPSQEGEGVRISSVYTNGPAQQAGLKTGDRILKVDGKEISSVKELQDSIDEMDPDHKAKITVMIDGEEDSLDIVVASKAETIKRAMVGNQSTAGGAAAANQTLSQTLTEIREELRDLRQRVEAMEKGDSASDRKDDSDAESDDTDKNQ